MLPLAEDKSNLQRGPDPDHKAAEFSAGALQHCEILADNGKAALIEIATCGNGGWPIILRETD
jgi:hypothetical protein